MGSDPLCSSGAGCYTDHFKGESDPYDYYDVPDFGKDHDMEGTWDSLNQAEKMLNHQWIIQKKTAKPHPQDYFVPNFGLDHDVKDTFGAIAASEEQHGQKWNWKLQPKKSFEKGTTVSNYQKMIMNTPAKNFESVLDGDIQTSLHNAREAEKTTGETWNVLNQE